MLPKVGERQGETLERSMTNGGRELGEQGGLGSDVQVLYDEGGKKVPALTKEVVTEKGVARPVSQHDQLELGVDGHDE